MKKIAILFTFMLLVMSLTAHPPKKITLRFDIKTQELDLKVNHSVKDMKDHFIKKITIKVNDNEVYSKSYTKQKDLKADVYRIRLENIKIGDKLELRARCNKWGKKSKKLIIK